jgi:CBS-domain-containing membrane protein
MSAIGGFTAILCIFIFCQWTVDAVAAAILSASMGASAVLLFVVLHGHLSQPWSVAGEHIIPALAGVSCAQWFANEVLAASLAE